jgi:drug/metabolite transporter (DMT)-like permease
MSQQKPPSEQDALLPHDEESTPGHHRKIRSLDFTPSTGGIGNRFGGIGKKHASSISALYDSMRNLRTNLEPIREDIVESAGNVRKAFVSELDKMDQGKTGFLDMTMTRSLSVMPDDLPEFVEEMGVKTEPEEAGPPIFQYLALLSAVLAVSSNATALHMLDGVKAPMKLYWRMTASYIVLSFFAIRSVMKEGFPRLSFGSWLTFAAAASCFSFGGVLFIRALDYTSIGNALIFANSQALLLIIGKAFVGERIHVFEACGVIVASMGAIMCARDSESGSSDDDANRAIIGDCLALAAAVAHVGYLTFAKAVRSHMPVSVFLFLVMFCGSFLVLFYIMIDPSLAVEFSMDPYDGLFGWFNLSEGRLPVLIYLACVVNCIGTMGFVRGA